MVWGYWLNACKALESSFELNPHTLHASHMVCIYQLHDPPWKSHGLHMDGDGGSLVDLLPLVDLNVCVCECQCVERVTDHLHNIAGHAESNW